MKVSKSEGVEKLESEEEQGWRKSKAEHEEKQGIIPRGGELVEGGDVAEVRRGNGEEDEAVKV
jgi:hypothetical protein